MKSARLIGIIAVIILVAVIAIVFIVPGRVTSPSSNTTAIQLQHTSPTNSPTQQISSFAPIDSNPGSYVGKNLTLAGHVDLAAENLKDLQGNTIAVKFPGQQAKQYYSNTNDSVTGTFSEYFNCSCSISSAQNGCVVGSSTTLICSYSGISWNVSQSNNPPAQVSSPGTCVYKGRVSTRLEINNATTGWYNCSAGSPNYYLNVTNVTMLSS